MSKVKLISIILSLTVTLGVLAGCGSSKQTASSGKLVDGTYKVEYDNFDSHGYKPQLEMTISGGKITAVKYDEVTKDGKFKSQDEKYKKDMEEGSNTYPEKAYNELKQRVIDKQTSAIDVVAGATTSSNSFKALLKYALDSMANKGTTTSAKIPTPKS